MFDFLDNVSNESRYNLFIEHTKRNKKLIVFHGAFYIMRNSLST